jgi:hypothetical protein
LEPFSCEIQLTLVGEVKARRALDSFKKPLEPRLMPNTFSRILDRDLETPNRRSKKK